MFKRILKDAGFRFVECLGGYEIYSDSEDFAVVDNREMLIMSKEQGLNFINEIKERVRFFFYVDLEYYREVERKIARGLLYAVNC